MVHEHEECVKSSDNLSQVANVDVVIDIENSETVEMLQVINYSNFSTLNKKSH